MLRVSLLFLCLVLVATICPAAVIELVAGGGVKEPPCLATEARLREPFGVEFTPTGEMIIVEMSKGERVLRMDRAGEVQLAAGTGKRGYAGDGGDPREAMFNGIHNLAVLPDGSLLLADTWNHRVRRIDAAFSTLETWAGTGEKGFSGDGGPAPQAKFGVIIQIALDAKGEHLYVADIENRRIRKIDVKTRVVQTVAGNGRKGVPMDGQRATESPLVDPRAVVPDANGGFYVLERGGHALRYVDAGGAIRTVVGTGKAGLSGDGGPAREATLNGPKHLCMDRDESVVIADAENHVIRRYVPKSGEIVRVAGTGKKGMSGVGGDPLACELNRPHGVTIGPDGSLYITDSYNDRVLRIVK